MSNRKEVEDRAEKLAEVSRLYYIYERKQKQIAYKEKHLGLKDSSAVARLLKEARELGVIAFDVDPSFAIVGREEERLSREIRDAFQLDHATVIEVSLSQSVSTNGNIEPDPTEDDYLHTVLANHTGVQIKDRIESTDHIAVAGGRAVYQTVRVIRRGRPSCRDIQITPLSGRIWTHSWEVHGPYIERPIDADDAAFVLALAFENEPGTKFSQVTNPLFATNAKEAKRAIEQFCPFLPDGSWRDGKKPRRAIVGVGVIDPLSGHRCIEALRQPKRIDPYLNQVSDKLKEAVKLVEDNKLPYFGDVANRFFPALYLPNQLEPSTLEGATTAYDVLIKALTNLNSRMTVVNWHHLNSIPSVTAVAGGHLKLRALWTPLIAGLINRDKRIITSLTTDTESAEELITARRDFDRADSLIQQWYKDMVERLFSN